MSGFCLNNINVTIGSHSLLRELTLSIPEKKLTAIMGLNGAGKSTLLRVLSGYRLPNTGSITWAGNPLQSIGTQKLARTIAVVPQDFPTDFPYTVREFALMGRQPWQSGLFPGRDDHQRVHATLARLELIDKTERTVTTLSGGEKQRLLLARALIQDTPVILLDEPANHLDIKHRLFLLDLLRDAVTREGRTVIAVTHDFTDVQRFFDDAILLKDGALSFAGSVSAAFAPEQLHACFDMDVAEHLGLVKSAEKVGGWCGFPNDF